MTGYGRGIVGDFKVEVRSSNHRNLDLQLNIPSYLFYYEAEIRKLVRQKFQRGRIEIWVSKQEGDNIKLRINKSLAREYYNALISLKNELSLSGDVGIDVLTSQRDIFLLETPEIKLSEFHKALNTALEELKKMRIEEGENLAKDISERIQLLHKYITYIEDKRTEFIAKAKKRLYERLKEILDNISIDESRLIQETAILIEKSDITEEIVRIKSHLRHIEEALKSGDVVGKKIDFLAQALYREVNTISSKNPDVEIVTYAVEMKHELEKIREQTQNLQ
jgi:uncharacterized protein (TIGR00255 family)